MNISGKSVAVIGGGFYGACIAEHLSRRGATVTLFEREERLMTRASYCNQARLHGGYHYPRSFGTAYRSRLNFSRFNEEFSPAIERNFTKLYAIARVNSKVNARQFEAFCRNIGAPYTKARKEYASLFNPHLVEAIYETDEYVFDAARLGSIMLNRLEAAGVTIRCGCRVLGLTKRATGGWSLTTNKGCSDASDLVINCTYSGINTLQGLAHTRHQIKQEIAEMALIELPPQLAAVSVTLMDGPFFSFMPFPDRQLTSLSHVRYTPHANWFEATDGVRDPYRALEEFPRVSRFPHMIRDAQRYLPALREAVYRDSLFEVKTVLVGNETDDGRPILYESDYDASGVYWVLGSKIDNVYDALAALDESLHPAHAKTLTIR